MTLKRSRHIFSQYTSLQLTFVPPPFGLDSSTFWDSTLFIVTSCFFTCIRPPCSKSAWWPLENSRRPIRDIVPPLTAICWETWTNDNQPSYFGVSYFQINPPEFDNAHWTPFGSAGWKIDKSAHWKMDNCPVFRSMIWLIISVFYIFFQELRAFKDVQRNSITMAPWLSSARLQETFAGR